MQGRRNKESRRKEGNSRVQTQVNLRHETKLMRVTGIDTEYYKCKREKLIDQIFFEIGIGVLKYGGSCIIKYLSRVTDFVFFTLSSFPFPL